MFLESHNLLENVIEAKLPFNWEVGIACSFIYVICWFEKTFSFLLPLQLTKYYEHGLQTIARCSVWTFTFNL